MKLHKRPKRIIQPRMLTRVKKTDTDQLLQWLIGVATSTEIAVESWRFRNGSPADVQMSVDALHAIWEEIKARGLTGPVHS